MVSRDRKPVKHRKVGPPQAVHLVNPPADSASIWAASKKGEPTPSQREQSCRSAEKQMAANTCDKQQGEDADDDAGAGAA